MSRTCVSCGGPLGGPEARTVPYRALPGVFLDGVPVWTCGECGEEEVGIPRLEQLQRLLVHVVARRPGHLQPPEIRFLRKHLGWSGREFASAFGVAPETVSRWEHGERNMGATAERLLRLLATRMEPVATIADLAPVLHGPDADQGADGPIHLLLGPDSEWSEAA